MVGIVFLIPLYLTQENCISQPDLAMTKYLRKQLKGRKTYPSFWASGPVALCAWEEHHSYSAYVMEKALQPIASRKQGVRRGA